MTIPSVTNSATNYNGTGGQTTNDVTLTVSSASGRVLVAFPAMYNYPLDAGDAISSVVFDPGGSDEASFTVEVTNVYDVGERRNIAAVYGLILDDGVSSGDYTIRATWTAAIDDSAIAVWEVADADTTDPFGANAVASGSESSSAMGTTVTTTATNSLVANVTKARDNGNFTPTNGTEETDEAGANASLWTAWTNAAAITDYTVDAEQGTGGNQWNAVGVEILEAAGGTTYNQAAAGALTTSGVYSLLVSLSYAGVLSSAGVLVSQVQKALIGSLSSAGTLAKTTILNYAGTLTSSGAVSAIKTVLQALAGSLTSSGALVSQGQKVLTGSFLSLFTDSGDVTKQTILSYTGTLTSSGAFSSIRTFLQALAGTLTSSGILSNLPLKQLVGSLTSAGASAKQTILSYTGTLTSAGTLSSIKAFFQSLSGFLLGSASNFGILSKKPILSYSGTLTSSSTSIKTTLTSFAGSLSSSGSFLKMAILTRAGTLTSSGIRSSIKNVVVETIDLTLNSRSVSFLLNARSTAMTLIQRAIDFTVGTRE